jgi:hypothetical protein
MLQQFYYLQQVDFSHNAKIKFKTQRYKVYISMQTAS